MNEAQRKAKWMEEWGNVCLLLFTGFLALSFLVWQAIPVSIFFAVLTVLFNQQKNYYGLIYRLGGKK